MRAWFQASKNSPLCKMCLIRTSTLFPPHFHPLSIRIASRCRVQFQDCRQTLFGCRILINEINANHEARTPEGLARNVVLIKELNSNVSKVSNTT